MKISPRIHQQLRIKNTTITLVILLVLGCLAWITHIYTVEFDWTASQHNSLSKASAQVLDSMPDKISLTAYINDNLELRKQITQVIKPYIRYSSNLSLNFIPMSAQPDKVREFGIFGEGAILINYQGRTEKIDNLNESTVTNALLRLSSTKPRGIAFLSGHGERAADGDSHNDLTEFSESLQRRQIKVFTLNLANLGAIPDNASLLVIAGLYTALLQNEQTIIENYLQRGGNLLWLRDPGEHQAQELEALLGIRMPPGTILDSSAKLFGIDNPSHILVTEYPQHSLIQDFKITTLFPIAAMLQEITDANTEFVVEPLLNSVFSAWAETDTNITAESHFDADSDDQEGPLTLAYALTRITELQQQQRIVIVGDGDFLSNTFVHQVGNLNLGHRIINWLTYDDRFIDIAPKQATDASLQLSKTALGFIGYGFLLVLPLTFFIAGLTIWYFRKRS